MPKSRSRVTEVHSHLALRVKSYSANTSASVTHADCTPTLIDENELAHSFGTGLDLIAVTHWPEERAEEEFWLSIYGLKPMDWRLRRRLKDYQAVDEQGSLKYRKYRGDYYPIYELPKQIGYLQKNRHYGVWAGAAWVSPDVASDMLTMLLHIEAPYLALHEIRISRKRGIVRISLQTNDPAEE